MIIRLDEFWKSLLEQVENKQITMDTARTYYSCIKVIHDTCGSHVKYEELHTMLKAKSMDKLSQFAAAIKKYEANVLKNYGGSISKRIYSELKNMKIKQVGTEPSRGSQEATGNILRKINALSNQKLKYAFRLQYKSGLRVSEISKLTKDDFSFSDDGKIKIHVRNGKGRKCRVVEVLEDTYLYKNLKIFVEAALEGRLFYSRDYLKQKAAEYGFETHDLRRDNAKNRLKEELASGSSVRKAKRVVQKQLGHASVSTTNIYLC